MAARLKFYSPKTAHILQLAQQIRAYERISHDEHMALQNIQLHALLMHARQHSPFWKMRLDEARFDGSKPCREAFDRLPELKRTDFQESFDSLKAHWFSLKEEQIGVAVTSGSTGQPVRIERYNDTYVPLYQALGLIDMEWHQRDPSKSIAIFGTVDGVQPSWGELYASLGFHGKSLMRNVFGQSARSNCEWLQQHQPDYLKATSFVATELAQFLLDEGLKFPLRQIISQYERVTPQQRVLCQQAFGARVTDRYTCEEAGWIALQCPKHDHLHVMNASVLIEIVDDDGNPCPPGKIGRVLLTSLHSFAMPIIRYDLGDLAEWGEACDCGITLPVIKHLWGRTRHRVMLANGDYFPMPFFGDDLGKIKSIREFKIIQYSDGEIEVLINAKTPLFEEQKLEIYSFFKTYGFNKLIHIIEVDSIDWGSGRKREEFIRVDYPRIS